MPWVRSRLLLIRSRSELTKSAASIGHWTICKDGRTLGIILKQPWSVDLQGGLVREKLWDVLQNEPDVVMEEGFPNSTGRSQSIKGMRSSQFCLHPAGDTPTSCRLFDAIASLCIPVIVSDNIPLPFEGIIDYSQFALFISESQALQKNYLVTYLRSISVKRKERLRANMARVQSHFEFDNGFPGGVGPVPRDGAVNLIWEMVYQKVANVRQAILREKRRPEGVVVPLRCHCTWFL